MLQRQRFRGTNSCRAYPSSSELRRRADRANRRSCTDFLTQRQTRGHAQIVSRTKQSQCRREKECARPHDLPTASFALSLNCDVTPAVPLEIGASDADASAASAQPTSQMLGGVAPLPRTDSKKEVSANARCYLVSSRACTDFPLQKCHVGAVIRRQNAATKEHA